jgi:predicted RNA polymerase sigma factor
VIEGLLRELAPQVLGVLVRRYGSFDACEDAVQEALLTAATRWPVDGVPDNPKGWLITVASRRRIELWRADTARRRREETALPATVGEQRITGCPERGPSRVVNAPVQDITPA